MLTWRFVSEFGQRMGRKISRIARSDMERLETYDWPGNVRELRNAADRHALGIALQPAEDRSPEQQRLAHRVAAFEPAVIVATLAAHGGRLKPVYESLGLSRKSLYEKMQKYMIDKTHYVDAGDDPDP